MIYSDFRTAKGWRCTDAGLCVVCDAGGLGEARGACAGSGSEV